VGEIGRGGMGVVYRALDPTIGRTVAIKTILVAGQGSEEQALARRGRLLRESQAAGQLSHPNIVAVHDVGEQGDTTYIVMEYVVGQTLEQSMAAAPGPRNAAESLGILADCARALDYPHSKGVVHRDVKPGNIILQSDGVVKIADFGIAKMLESSTLTQTATVIGSPHFMAPEQLKGEPVSGRTDQYALAVVAYALLAGQLPFDADTMATLVTKTLYQDPPSVPPLNAAVDIVGDGVLRKALAKTPEARYGSCSEFVGALRAALEPGSASATATIAMPRMESTPQTPPPSTPVPTAATPPPTAAPVPVPPRRRKRLWYVWAAMGLIFAFRGVFMENKSRSAKSELAYWSSIQDRKSPALFEAYLNKYPDGRFADLARTQIEALKVAPDSEAAAAALPAAGGVNSPQSAAPAKPKPTASDAVGVAVPAPPPVTAPPPAPPQAATVATSQAVSQAPAPTCKAEFTTIATDKFQPCLDYWSGKGYSPLTFAAAKETEGTVVLTGAFQASGANKITLLEPAEKRLPDLAEFKRQNYRPDSVNVLRSSEGPRFTTIWTPVQGSYEARPALVQAELESKLQQHGSDGLAIIDVVAFGPKDATRFHAIWNQSGVPARALLNLSAQDLRQKSTQLQQEGYVVGRVNSYRTGDGIRYAAVFEKGQPESMYYVGMTGFDLQIRQNEAVLKGMRLHYISHAEGRFSAVWRK
jgi:serine/threonine-protein kinase